MLLGGIGLCSDLCISTSCVEWPRPCRPLARHALAEPIDSILTEAFASFHNASGGKMSKPTWLYRNTTALTRYATFQD